MTYDELVEKVAKIVVNNNLLKVPSRTTAEEIIDTIRAALHEPTEGMIAAVLKHYGTDFDNEFAVDNINDDWSKMLAASPLVEERE